MFDQRRVDAWAMIAIGTLIVGLCGLCTYNVARTGDGYGMEYIVGGLPILAGLLMILRGGLKLAAISRKPPGDGGTRS